MMRIASLRRVGGKVGRSGMSELVIAAVNEFDNGTYKEAMELCGKLELIAKMATCDEYWAGIVSIGRSKMLSKLHDIDENQ